MWEKSEGIFSTEAPQLMQHPGDWSTVWGPRNSGAVPISVRRRGHPCVMWQGHIRHDCFMA